MKVLFLYLWLFYKDSPWPTLKDNMTVIPRCDVFQGASLGSGGFYEEGNWRHISDKAHRRHRIWDLEKGLCGKKEGNRTNLAIMFIIFLELQSTLNMTINSVCLE